MGNFNRDGGDDRGGNRSGGYSSYNRRDSDRPEMHKATCAECGKPCEVPFRPSGDKPVYCRECFNLRGDRDGNDRGNRNFNRSDRPDYGEKQMFSATCDSCGKRCEVPFRPSGDKPVYCSNCFGHKEDPKPQKPNTELTDQLKSMNEKLDRLLRALELRGKIETVKGVAPKKIVAVTKKTVKTKSATKKKPVVKKV